MYVTLHVMVVVFCVFFFKQKTAYEMRISDWSSDVCSSDLLRIDQLAFVPRRILLHDVAVGLVAVGAEAEARLFQRVADIEVRPAELVVAKQIGRASCRERVCQYV